MGHKIVNDSIHEMEKQFNQTLLQSMTRHITVQSHPQKGASEYKKAPTEQPGLAINVY